MASIDPYSHNQVGYDTYNDQGFYFLLRHAKAQKDAMQHPRDWFISEEGQHQATLVADDPDLQRIEIIYSSPETKALQTATIVADILGINIIEIEDLHEVHLDRYYDTEVEFMLMKESKFINPSLDIGESHQDALSRFSTVIDGIKSYNPNQQVLIISHGTIMSLFIGRSLGLSCQETFELWKNMEFCHLEQL